MKIFMKFLVFPAAIAVSFQCSPLRAYGQSGEPVSSEKIDFTVRRIGPFFEKGKNAHVLGQDGAYSIRVDTRTVLWLFADTWIGEIKPDGKQSVWGASTNGGAVSRSSSAYSLPGSLEYFQDENGWPVSVLTYGADENQSVRRLWPRHGLVSGDRVYVFYSLIQQFGPAQGEFAHVGQGVAYTGTKSPGTFVRLRSGNGYVFWNDVEPAFGSAALRDSDGWIYLYGRKLTEPGKYAMVLARVRDGDIADKSRYGYYGAGNSTAAWTSDISDAAFLFEDAPEELSVSFNDFLKLYVMVYSDASGRAALMRTADDPWGPWSGAAEIFTCNSARPENVCYGAKEHPELSEEGGRTMFFTIINNKDSVPALYEMRFKSR